MAGSLNKVCLIGNLGRDPEARRMNNGGSVVSFSMAMTESWRDKTTGERKDKTEWANIVIFDENIAKVAEQYLKKGAKIYVEGALQTREYTDKDGNQRKTTEIVLQKFRGTLTMLESAKGGGEDRGGAGSYSGNASGGSAYGGGGGGNVSSGRQPTNDLDDDIPF